MRQIAFSGMWCSPHGVEKDGDFRIRGTMSPPGAIGVPAMYRYEYFASRDERDVRYRQVMRQLEDGFRP